MRFFKLVAAVFLVFQTTAVGAQADLAKVFGVRESIANISLSPNGQRVAYIQPVGARSDALYIADVQGGQPKGVSSTDGAPWRLSWCVWVSNSRLTCQLYAVSEIDAVPVSVSRMIAVNDDGTVVKQLGKAATSRSLYGSTNDGYLVGLPVTDDNRILMARTYVPESSIGTNLASSAEGLGVDLVDTINLKSTRSEPARDRAFDYTADQAGVVRIMGVQDVANSGYLTGVFRYFYRAANERRWQPFSVHSEKAPGLRPVAVDSAQNVAYAIGKKDGREAVYTVGLAGDLTPKLMFANDKVDAGNLLRLGRTGRVIGVDYVTDKRESAIFDPEYKNLAARLVKALPGLPLVQFVDASRDESRLLLFVGSDTDPGRYYVYDKPTKRLNEIVLARPDLEGKSLAKVQSVLYPASDGTMIPGYLTLPPGGPTKSLPAIVMPHGGPSYRDEWGFDWLSQYFASQGFAVLQPNFRGSAGYGDDWYQNNGFQSWKVAIGDVNDAGRWLVSQGIADKEKLAIFGWSYGGYAALQSGVLAPDLYKAAVAVAPVTDLRLLAQQAQSYTNARIVRDFIGQGEHLNSGSPRVNAAALRAPVLMLSGDKDLNVNVSHAKAMHFALLAAGKSSELVIYPGLDHSLPDSTVRADLLQKSSTFFRTKLGIK